MLSFEKQPVTWLFLVATALLDVVLLGVKHGEPLLIAMVLGQLFITGGWLVVGRSHRLLRGGAFVALTLAIAVLISTRFLEPPHFPFREAWARSLGWSSITSGSAAIMTFIGRNALQLASRRQNHSPRKGRWQFSIMEVFGWMIIVAVVSAVLPYARISRAIDELFITILCSLVAALMIAMFLMADGRRNVPSGIIAATAVATQFAVLSRFVNSWDNEVVAVVAGSYVYVMLWVFVRRLDEHIERVTAAIDKTRPPRWDTIEHG